MDFVTRGLVDSTKTITVVSGNSGRKFTCKALNRHQGAGATLACQDCKPVRTWMGAKPVSCQICGTTLSDKFVDGATRFGPWAIMCPACHRDQALGLGTGRGQMYDLDSLEKVEG